MPRAHLAAEEAREEALVSRVVRRQLVDGSKHASVEARARREHQQAGVERKDGRPAARRRVPACSALHHASVGPVAVEHRRRRAHRRAEEVVNVASHNDVDIERDHPIEFGEAEEVELHKRLRHPHVSPRARRRRLQRRQRQDAHSEADKRHEGVRTHILLQEDSRKGGAHVA